MIPLQHDQNIWSKNAKEFTDYKCISLVPIFHALSVFAKHYAHELFRENIPPE